MKKYDKGDAKTRWYWFNLWQIARKE